ncbi:hypothetical protein BUALT_Bualt18G0046600 [Buddleja alternifolia]|uniref:Uncharacterized protein n=1 Tax=Buddleja alternifolia TaxID=168488 RepID=A0AAV6WD67_9LAMI|nr:hypothetical protein BUALT_Bualt18G0046600 [Buddleja alternifolia]
MAEATRYKEGIESLRKHDGMLIEERALRSANEEQAQIQLNGLQHSLGGMEKMQMMMQQQLQTIVEQMQQYNRNKSILGEGLSATNERGNGQQPAAQIPPTHSNGEGCSNTSSHTSFSRLEFPRFEGVDPRSWLRRCSRYFQLVSTITEDQQVPLASIHLEDKAELWFQSFMEGRDMPTW